MLVNSNCIICGCSFAISISVSTCACRLSYLSEGPNVDCAWPGYVSAMFTLMYAVMLYTGGPSNKPGEAETLLTVHGKLVNMYAFGGCHWKHVIV